MMSAECKESLGALYLEKSSNKHSKQDVVIKCDYVQMLKPFQIHGIRFLYNNYLKGGGAVLNDDDSLGKTVQTVLFLFAVHSNTTKQSLIVCDEAKLHHWLYHFNKWTTIKASLSHQDISQASVVIAPLANCNIVSDKKWNIIVIDNLDSASTTYYKNILNANCAFKIWLADKNIKGNLKNVYKVLRWITCNNIGTQKKFESSLIGNDLSVVEAWKKRQYLNLQCNKLFLRRTARDVENQLPLINLENYRSEFESWLKSYNTSCEDTNSNNTDTGNSEDINSSKQSEDENLMDDSPSLLDMTSKSDAENSPKKRKKGKDPTGLMTKRSKTSSDAESTVEQHEISNTKGISSAQTSERMKESSKNVDCKLFNDNEHIKSESLDKEAEDTNTTIIKQAIKVEDEHSDKVKSKFSLLDSLFSDNQKALKSNEATQKMKQEHFEGFGDSNVANNINDSEKKTFKLLDRFFS